MRRLTIILKFVFCVVVGLIGSDISIAHQTGMASKKVDLAQMPLENVQIQEESLGKLLSNFSFAYNIPIGLEVASNANERPLYRFSLKKGTLSDLLMSFVAEHNEYDWRIENDVLSVFPKEVYRDPTVREVLATQISSFSVAEKTSAMAFGQNLLSTPEVKRILELRGMTYDAGYLGGFYIQQLGQQYSFEVSNMQLKSILDKVIKESPVAKYWIMSNKTSAQKLFLTVHAALEYTPKR